MSFDPISRFHVLDVCGVDLAKSFEEYFFKICTGNLSVGNDAHFSINFSKPALLLQESVHVYSRKVEYLYTLVLLFAALWGVFGLDDAVEFVHKLLKEGLPITVVYQRLVREAVLERHCKDNCITTIIVFKHN
ncbi:hypothetical protein Droror1_Dr00019871 [Drosera rotundifolia]